MVAIDVSKALEDRVNALATAAGRPAAAVIQAAVADYISDLEDGMAAEVWLADIRAGRARTYSIEEVEHSLGLDD
jgi:RHH-type rel operon transcriptional repressor/antitoxin RelB